MLKRGIMVGALIASMAGSIAVRAADVGEMAPEIRADRWYNAPGHVSLAQFRGQVVVVEFWATYCAPCHAVQPKLAAIHQRWAPQGVVLISMSDEPEAIVTPFLARKSASYILSAGGDTPRRFGIRGIPSAFVIDRNGAITWRGNPHEGGFEDAIERTVRSTGRGPSLAKPKNDANPYVEDLEELPRAGRGASGAGVTGSSSSQRPFEAGAARPAKKAVVAKTIARPIRKAAPNKRGSARKAVSTSKTSRESASVSKAKRASGKAKSARQVKKKSSSTRKPARRSSAKRK